MRSTPLTSTKLVDCWVPNKKTNKTNCHRLNPGSSPCPGFFRIREAVVLGSCHFDEPGVLAWSTIAQQPGCCKGIPNKNLALL